MKRNLSLRENLNSNIKSQTTRKLPLSYGDLPIREMHRGAEQRTSYIPFLLNQETRSDVIPVRLHFSYTLPQARQPISHRRVCVNNGLVSITHLKVSHGDIISFQENDARTRGEEISRSFYIDISVSKRIGKFLPVRIGEEPKQNGSAYSKLRGVPPTTKISVFARVAFFYARRRLRKNKEVWIRKSMLRQFLR
ncbi:hypothetical protein M5K25_028327 [Dendrobium thyrsiflorum]|uniref:RNA-binding S4 domain-containing protein n=1 Tax=Dendrobium thyrsiflorum TaxID=117978 RepID=A0ABD0TTS9_DENTH